MPEPIAPATPEHDQQLRALVTRWQPTLALVVDVCQAVQRWSRAQTVTPLEASELRARLDEVLDAREQAEIRTAEVEATLARLGDSTAVTRSAQ